MLLTGIGNTQTTPDCGVLLKVMNEMATDLAHRLREGDDSDGMPPRIEAMAQYNLSRFRMTRQNLPGALAAAKDALAAIEGAVAKTPGELAVRLG